MNNWIKLSVVTLFVGILAACQSASNSEPTMKDGASAAVMKTITGTVQYRQRIALPDNAVVTVTLEDVSLADAASVLITKQSFESEGKQVPIAFTLDYNTQQIIENHTYSVRAKIEVEGKLRFTTDTSYQVINDPNNTHELSLNLIAVK